MNELPQLSSCTSNAAYYTLTGTSLPTMTQSLPQDWMTQNFPPPTVVNPTQKEPEMSQRRVVQVFIADPNESVPLEKAILFQDEKPHLTDLTDQELFFEIDIQKVLKAHNEFRVTLDDRETFDSNQVRKLEPAKIRDLKMTVVTVAQF